MGKRIGVGLVVLAVALGFAVGLYSWFAQEARGSAAVRGGEASGDTERGAAQALRTAEGAAARSGVPVAAPRGGDAVPGAGGPAAAAGTAPGRLFGRVVRAADGRPVAGARVTTSHEGAAATTDAEGAYAIEFAEEATPYFVHVAPTATTAAKHDFVRLVIRPGRQVRYDAKVGSGGALEGRVVDAGGAPLAGAEVRVWCQREYEPERAPDRVTTSDGGGHFAVEHVGEEFVLDARLAGFACERGLRGELADGARAAGLEVRLVPAAALRGRVVDGAGRPVPDVALDLRADQSRGSDDATGADGVERFGSVRARALSGADGTFAFTGIPAGGGQLQARHDAFLPWSAQVEAGGEELLVRLDRGLGVGGLVLGPTGAPVAGARVRWVAPARATGGQAVTGEDGRFEIRPLDPTGDAFLTVRADGFALAALEDLTLATGASRDLVVRLEPGRALAGRVVDAQGAPVPDARVSIEGDRVLERPGVGYGEVTTLEWWCGLRRTRSDADGRFRIDGLYEGTFEVRASLREDERLFVETAARSGDEDLLLRLDQAAMERVVFAGRVVDALTGAPVTSFTVIPMDLTLGRGFTHDLDDEDGRFRLAGQAPGEHQVFVKATGYARWGSEARHFDVGEHDFDVRLLPKRSLQIVVRFAGGAVPQGPLGAEVFDRQGTQLDLEFGPASTMNHQTFWGGTASLAGLPADVLDLTLTGMELTEPQHVELDLRAPASEPLRIELPVAPRVRATLAFLSIDAASAAGLELGALGEPDFRRLYDAGSLRPIDVPVDVTFLDASGAPRARGRLTRGVDAWEYARVSGEEVAIEDARPEPVLKGWAPSGSARVQASAPGHADAAVPLRGGTVVQQVVLVRE